MKNDMEVPKNLQLPITIPVKYLGKRDAMGLWGIDHTKQPVADMVQAAKCLKLGMSLPFLQIKVSNKGIDVEENVGNLNKSFEEGHYAIDMISYGVQDVVYNRVFAMIVVREGNLRETHPFECHAFVCESRQSARLLTCALASAFREFSKVIKANKLKPKRFAIDLRTPEEIQAEVTQLDPDSEA